MKLELPDNNASVLFHMGNALQSIASDLDATYNNKTPLRADVSCMTQDELSDTVDKMIEAVAADWEAPVNRLTGNATDSDSTTTMLKGVGSIDAGTDADDVDPIIEISDTIDADGLPWDQRINSKGRTRIKGDVWRTRQKPNDKTDEEWAEYVEGVKTELRALMAIPVATDVNGVEFRQLSGEIHNVEINGTLEFPPIVDSATFEAVANGDIGAGQPVRIVTPPVVDAVVTPPVVDAVVTPPVVDAVVTPPVVDAVVTPPVVDAVVTPPVVDAVVTGPTTFPELMKFITVNNKKLTKESVDEALKAQGLASIALLAARTDLIPQVHVALVKLL